MSMTQSILQELPTAPPVTRGRMSVRARRLIGAAVASPSAGILLLAAYLEPSPTGLGTHTELNLPSCGWIATMDLPCPTCGMTTAFAHAADGHFIASFIAQPMGALLAVAVAMALPVGLYVALTGSPVASLFGRLWGRGAAWAVGIAVAAAWVYKILSYKGIL